MLRRLAKWLPQTLVARVFALYAVTLLVFVSAGLATFYRFHFEVTLEEAQQAGLMLNQMAGQIVTESAVIGDFDTIQRTLDKTVSRSPFASAAYIDVAGATLRAQAVPHAGSTPPQWLLEHITGSLSDVNQVIAAGGRDYGVLRLTFDAQRVASELWGLTRSALALAVAALVVGILVILYPLRRWLGTLERALEVGGSERPDQSPEVDSLMDDMPAEFRPMVQALNRTAATLRHELQARERALVSLRETLAGLRHEAGVPVADADDLASLSAAVARLVAEREASREALERALDAAEAVNRTKSEFLANMSHEIRTPINGIIGMTDLTLETPLSDEQREFLTVARSSANALMAVINDILDFSRLESGRLQIESLPFDPRETVQEALSVVRLQAQAKKLQLEHRCEGPVPEHLSGDPTRVRQVLLNLLGNAVKFTERGRIDVVLSCDQLEGPQPLLHLAVRDTGVGIAAAMHERIFEAFVQEDASTTRRYGGSGLGLSISRRLVELMGGRIWVESRPGEGSTFHVTLPLVEPRWQTAANAGPTTALASGS